ncbi:unnamed protein product [Bursaphelenchus xylophilus]|uniref:(pine wood nematode) hypothetical protein n=1 Tax=Bursaphelenchus xylophilus TaxID=6326 RepID=A0A1I7S7E6_BURXY|nr:unnamed protein product [Bursaphelenchus xylophilus]CAG9084999.1 unnamed protein product [Bursaphelenchus xylophilus]
MLRQIDRTSDVLFDAKTREVIKLVLHTNIPGHYNFGFYSRVSFEIECPTPEDFEDESVVIRTDSKLTDFINIFEDKTPVVVNRAPSSEGENPFGSTFCYGTDGMIVEVLDNAHIASLTLYKSGLSRKIYSGSDDDASKDSQSS